MDELEIMGLLSIQASLLRNKHSLKDLEEFVESCQKEGLLKNIDLQMQGTVNENVRIINLIYHIMEGCVTSSDLRITLQRWFGQFDGAQICQSCGKVMWNGYSWNGDTYCCIDCVMGGEGIGLSEVQEGLKDACDPDGPCYYTEWS